MTDDIPYRFTIRPLTKEEGGGYLIEFPDLPGCMSDGDTVEEAVRNGRDAMRGWLQVIEQEGRQAPEPEMSVLLR